MRVQSLIIIRTAERAKNYLADLELLQYDILYGKQYVYQKNRCSRSQKDIWKWVSKMRIVTDLISQLDGTYSIYGENFTKWSKVYVNDEKQDKYSS